MGAFSHRCGIEIWAFTELLELFDQSVINSLWTLFCWSREAVTCDQQSAPSDLWHTLFCSRLTDGAVNVGSCPSYMATWDTSKISHSQIFLLLSVHYSVVADRSGHLGCLPSCLACVTNMWKPHCL